MFGAKRSRDFVLVHGGAHGGWAFDRVAERLRAKGRRVFTPTLTGLGDRSHLAHVGVTCSMHIQDVVNLMAWEGVTDAVLCGHSYGGMVIGGAADRVPGKVSALVYLDAAIPIDGKSTLDLLSPETQEAMRAVVYEDRGVAMLPAPPAAAYNLASAADREMVDRLCTPHPFASLTEKLSLTGAYRTIARKRFVLATGWDGTHPRQVYEAMKAEMAADPSWSVVKVGCGHEVMLDEPARLARILLDML
jgi:pimeloyl-ACP methyl ester carboxylesterase